MSDIFEQPLKDDSDSEDSFVMEVFVESDEDVVLDTTDTALGIHPYRFEPYKDESGAGGDDQQDVDSDSSEGGDEHGQEHDIGRLQNNEW